LLGSDREELGIGSGLGMRIEDLNLTLCVRVRPCIQYDVNKTDIQSAMDNSSTSFELAYHPRNVAYFSSINDLNY